jgi:hypothetical protein
MACRMLSLLDCKERSRRFGGKSNDRRIALRPHSNEMGGYYDQKRLLSKIGRISDRRIR